MAGGGGESIAPRGSGPVLGAAGGAVPDSTAGSDGNPVALAGPTFDALIAHLGGMEERLHAFIAAKEVEVGGRARTRRSSKSKVCAIS